MLNYFITHRYTHTQTHIDKCMTHYPLDLSLRCGENSWWNVRDLSVVLQSNFDAIASKLVTIEQYTVIRFGQVQFACLQTKHDQFNRRTCFCWKHTYTRHWQLVGFYVTFQTSARNFSLLLFHFLSLISPSANQFNGLKWVHAKDECIGLWSTAVALISVSRQSALL